MTTGEDAFAGIRILTQENVVMVMTTERKA